MRVKCFDVVEMVVDEATERFSALWDVNEQKKDVLKQYCGVIDELADEFDGESFDVEVDETKMTITITMECEDLIFDSSNHKFYEIAKRSPKMKFFVSEEGLLGVSFTFPSIWESLL